MKRGWRLCLLIAWWSSLWLAASARAALHVDTSYAGRYRGHPEYARFLADLPFVYQEALQRINHSLGIPIIEDLQVIVVFSDHLTHNGMRLRGKRRSVIGSEGRILHYIYLDLQFLMEGQATLIEEMTHELTHAVMAQIMGLDRYDALPMWVKEGTAVHAADQGLARIKALMRRGFDLSFLANEDESDDGNPISLEKYVANYLKVQFLLKTYGMPAFHRFIQELLKSGDVRRELRLCFNGLTEDVMTRYANDYVARTLIANAQPVHAREQLARGMRFFEEKEYLSARLALTDALYGGLTDKEFQKAAYLLAECYIQERNPQSAFSFLQRIKPDPRSIPIDRYKFLSAYTQYAMGLSSEAYLGFREAYATSRSLAVREGALYYIIRILVEVGNFEEAARVLNFLRTQFPTSTYIPLATRVYAARR
ncbi:MAG: hypothetical protein OZSIB_3445 [Candidatus Ozemobacter sibiricus]|uniref:Peptidase MA-like domain-containing protein n=1 Tax=Candidatus Ozemobacter sibiricus TaxID=2268124 RepID=A0A367ZQ74_9BACT|nr:MAG: hypothetical protein OZSIB_3445 [Candidatus Ozemobacter sibiricus]